MARRLGVDDADYLAAIHLALDVPVRADGQPADAVLDLLNSARRWSRPLDLVFGVFEREVLRSAVVALLSPGAAGLVFVPRRSPLERSLELREALGALQRAAWAQSAGLLESLVPPDAEAVGAMLASAGFRRLTQLVYLIRGTALPAGAAEARPDVRWIAYDETPACLDLFCRALELSYVQTLDCPELTGTRKTAEVLAGHRATGEFEAAGWWLAEVQGRLAGVLLLNRLPHTAAMELVYVGVAQAFRGTGLADALLHRAVRVARRSGARQLTLAVDDRNTPARRMYARWDFQETLRRDAWIATNPAVRG